MRGVVTSVSNPLPIIEGSGADRISIRLVDGILRISVEHEPPGECILVAVSKGIAAGWIRPNMLALVDLTRFTGSVDWAAMRAVKDLAPWGAGPTGRSRVAYLVRNDVFRFLIRATAALFMRTQHRTFRTEADALVWLNSA